MTDYRGMAEVIRLNCADLDTATEVLRGYLQQARGDAIQTYLRESLPHLLEGARDDARHEVRAAAEEWFCDLSLEDLFRTKGWPA